MDVDGQWEGGGEMVSFRGVCAGVGMDAVVFVPTLFTQDSIVMSCGEMGTFGVTGVSGIHGRRRGRMQSPKPPPGMDKCKSSPLKLTSLPSLR